MPSSHVGSRPTKGILLVNLGTPVSTSVSDVRRYLRQFLSDPRVIDIPYVFRILLLYLFILPFRPKKSAHAYKSIWTDEGSPLLVESQKLVEKVQAELGTEYKVELGMRYAEPSIESALKKIEAIPCETIYVVPLFPHYSSASTGSALQEVMRVLSLKWNVPAIKIQPPFFDDQGFLDAFAEIFKKRTENFDFDYVLFSYHGLPERHMHKSDTSPKQNYCLKSENCCDAIGNANLFCYKAQCYVTSKGLVNRLGLSVGKYQTTFQSRLGRTPWIRPYTDVVLEDIAKKGHKKIAVMCPAFTADCLETLEEIGMRAKEDWIRWGGEDLIMVPSLNSHPTWVRTVCEWIRQPGR